MNNIQAEGVVEEVARRLMCLQPRCINCGETFMLQIHHRIFRSQELELRKFLEEQGKCYANCYKKPFSIWGMHDIQNLCVLCEKCHTGKGTGVHGGNEELRRKLKHSFTCKETGFNINFFKKTLTW